MPGKSLTLHRVHCMCQMCIQGQHWYYHSQPSTVIHSCMAVRPIQVQPAQPLLKFLKVLIKFRSFALRIQLSVVLSNMCL